MSEALGIIECLNVATLLEASDVILKSTHVEILPYHVGKEGLLTLIVKGHLDQVKKAIEVGVRAGENVGNIHSLHIIPEPHPQLCNLFIRLMDPSLQPNLETK